MNRSQDNVIEDDEESCPLCIEEFDLSDKNFRPCPCGYQICQFCFNSLKNTYEKSTCPNCRRPYDEKTIQYKIPTAEEFKLDQLNKNKKQAAAKRKETEKREVENSSRRNLAGVRVKQQNLVYVIGLIPSLKDEQALLQTLRGPEFFGQYGDIEKIVVSKAKPGAANQGIGVYVTYARKEDAALCISTVDGSLNGDRVLRAQFGTTKYCSAYLRNEVCNNKSCSFLHENGEDGQSSSLQNEPHTIKAPTKPLATTQTAAIAIPPRPLSGASLTQPMARSDSRDEGLSRKNSHDASALPSTASWANTNAPVARTRRASQANSHATPSPQLTHALLAGHKTEEPKPKDSPTPAQPPIAHVPKKASPIPELAAPKSRSKHVDPIQEQYDYVLRTVSQNYAFVYDDSCLSPEVRAQVETMPSFIDPFGGAKRRAMREREEAERARIEADTRAKLEAQAISAAEETLDEADMAAGSLALGGEPEDDPRALSARGAIGRPSQPLSDQFTNLNLNSRSLTPQQRQQSSQQSSGLTQTISRNTAFDMSDFDRREPQYSQAQFEQINNHQRHGSRYFNNDSKSSSANRFQGQQQAFYSSGVQGPPPGLPTAGTPPVSGGGMFAHGQNFTNPGFGSSKDTNAENYSVRNRSGTNQGHENAKRGGVEHLADPSNVQTRTQPGNSTGQGLFGGNQVDEDNFPPLPARVETMVSALHSRVSSFHSLHSSGLRSSTPKIPPGFELTHAHPTPASEQPSPVANLNSTQINMSPQRSTSTTAPIIAPAVPLIPMAPRTSTPKLKAAETPKSLQQDIGSAGVPVTPAEVKGQTSEAIKISLGSPKPRASKSKVNDKEHKNIEIAGQTLTSRDEGKGKQKAVVTKPDRSDIPPVPPVPSDVQGLHLGAEKAGTPLSGSAIVEASDAQSSRPATPATTTPSDSSKASMARPRTLRLTTGMISKVSEPHPLSATTEKSSVMPPTPAAKRGSRRPSISSAQYSRPSTPALSELLSHDVSRANSPPPSIVGSAYERGKSKSQQKKDRRDKAKKNTEQGESVTPASASTSTQPSMEEVAPVIARQKKQKRRVESNTAGSTEEMTKSSSKASVETSNVQPSPSKPRQSPVEKESAIATPAKKHNLTKVEEREKSAVDTQKPGKVTPPVPMSPSPQLPEPTEESVSPAVAKLEDTVRGSFTLRDLYSDVGKMVGPNGTPAEASAAIQKLLNEHVSPMSKLISSMIQSGDLSKDHPWLNPPSFNSAAYKLPSDSRRAQEYLDGNGYSATDAFGHVYLPLKEKHALKEGHCVSIADGGDKKDDLLKKCLITSNGWVLRHLSGDETQKIIELNERRPMYLDEFGEVGIMDGLGALEHDDFLNLTGGMERLSRHGEQHGVVWVAGDGEEADLAEDDDDDDEFEIFDDDDAEIDGEIGIPSDDEEFEILHDDDMEPIPTSVREGLGGLNAAPDGAWDLPPPTMSQYPHLARQSRQSLPGLGFHSKTNAFARAKNLGTSPTSPTATTATTTANPSGGKNGHRHHSHGAQSSGVSAATGATNASRESSSVGLATHVNHSPVNLRALDNEALARRVVETQKELEASRKEMEKMEKLWNKKSKDIGRWREVLSKV